MALAVCGAGFGTYVLVVTAPGRYPTTTTILFSGAVGGLYLGAGLLARLRRPGNRVGLMMLLVGIGWFAEDLQISLDPVVHTVGLLVRSASSGFLIPLLLMFPDGRLRTRIDRVLAGAGYLTAFVLMPATVPFSTSVVRNLLLVHPVDWVRPATDVVQFVMSGAVVAVLLVRWTTATRPARRVLTPLFAVGLVGGLASALDGMLGTGPSWTHTPLINIAHVAVLLLPLAFLAGVWRVRMGRTAVADLLRRMPLASKEQLRDALARALGDTSVQVGFPAPDATGYLDSQGRTLGAAPGQQVSALERNGRRVGVLLHDPALREDRYVLEAVVSAVALELDNQRLAAEVRAQLAEVRASRARIVEAGDEQRRRIEHDLHDGAQSRFVTALVTLRLARQRLTNQPTPDPGLAELLDRIAELMGEGMDQLRDLAHGIHPAVLSETGLVAALEMIAARSPCPVRVSAAAVPELPRPLAATAYFVAAEAVTNALKHAGATTITIDVRHEDGVLRLAVADDGVGGADPDRGTGLLGLRDRVAVFDGEMTISSAPGQGTVVSATLLTGDSGRAAPVQGEDGRG
ncbi:sensor histidine kinase [Streptomyces xylophagus]|uniref:sensor histidine kinase n=1 Tax=Streptomyces xylophagus TaxID=285514 RepID=UPI001F3AD8E5|nr:ATP-binding protein [Streptomyces xylophagus]